MAPQADQVALDPNSFVDRHRVRIDPVKADGTDALLRFEFPDQPACGLHIRNGVAYYVADADAGDIQAVATLKMTGKTWQQLYVNEAELEDLITSGEVTVAGDAGKAVELLNLFDRLKIERNTILRPAASIHAP